MVQRREIGEAERSVDEHIDQMECKILISSTIILRNVTIAIKFQVHSHILLGAMVIPWALVSLNKTTQYIKHKVIIAIVNYTQTV